MPIPSGVNNSGNLWTGWSHLQFYPSIPIFHAPSGVLLHKEAYKLLPNYAYPNYQTIPKYSVQAGGSYPSLPQSNVFNIYLNITWSAEAGTAINCN